MAIDAETARRLLELAYDVLPDDEAAALRERIDAEPELAQAVAAAQRTVGLLREAARLSAAKIELKRPESPLPAAVKAASTRRTTGAHAAAPAHRLGAAPWRRTANLVAWLASTILLLVSLGGYWYHRGQLADISAEHLRLTVVGPARLCPGVASHYAVITSAVTGDPVSAQINFSLHSPDGRTLLMGHKEKTDEDGYLLVTVPAETPVADGVELKIVATDNDKVEQVAARLAIVPPGYTTQLTVDRPQYGPGETVRYRSLTLTRAGLTPGRALPIEFAVRDPRGVVVPGSEVKAVTHRGIGCGQIRLPAEAIAGTYTLVLRSRDGALAEQRLPFTVGGASPQPKSSPANPDKPDVSFYPEGGTLVAGLENRVYFSARDASGKPVPLVGSVIDREGEEVAVVKATHEGRGVFSLDPRAGDSYRLRFQTSAGTKAEASLPEVASQPGVVLTTGLGVFEPGEPLEFNIRATHDDLPLVAAAYCRGALVGHQAFVASRGANEVAIDLDDEASGVIRLVVYDYGGKPPRPLAERLVYRRLSRELYVQVEKPRQPDRPGQKAEISLTVTEETGRPVQATLGIAVLDATTPEAARPPGPSAATFFPLSVALRNPPEIEELGVCLANDAKADVALDLVLGTQGRKGGAVKDLREKHKGGRDDRAEGLTLAAGLAPPAVYDNLIELQDRYTESLLAYRSSRTKTLSTLTTLGFFGGAGLLLLATLLTLLNVTAGLWLWVPIVVASSVCLWTGTILVRPATLDARSDGAVVFVPFHIEPEAPGPEAANDQPVGWPATADEPAVEPDACADTHPEPSHESATTLYWHPGLLTDAKGRATIRFDLPASATAIRLRLDAHAPGRLGSLDMTKAEGGREKAEE